VPLADLQEDTQLRCREPVNQQGLLERENAQGIETIEFEQDLDPLGHGFRLHRSAFQGVDSVN
jgi:hypothetical protein